MRPEILSAEQNAFSKHKKRVCQAAAVNQTLSRYSSVLPMTLIFPVARGTPDTSSFISHGSADYSAPLYSGSRLPVNKRDETQKVR